MREWENQGRFPYVLEALTVLVSINPCLMCLMRLLLSGVGSVDYMASDRDEKC